MSRPMKAIFVAMQTFVIVMTVGTAYQSADVEFLLLVIGGLFAAFNLGTLFCEHDSAN